MKNTKAVGRKVVALILSVMIMISVFCFAGCSDKSGVNDTHTNYDNEDAIVVNYDDYKKLKKNHEETKTDYSGQVRTDAVRVIMES